MRFAKLLLIIIPFFTSSFQTIQTNTYNHKKWISLFNGKNLNGWIPKIAGYILGENFGNTFRVENGLLCTDYDAYGNFKNRFGALYYNKKFTSYRLRFQYRYVGDTVAGAPSWGYKDGGIQYHCQNPASIEINQSFPVCLEYNLLGTKPSGEICANGIYVEVDGKRNTAYCTPPTVKKIMPGNEWVIAEIDVHDGVIAHYINGEKVIEFKNPKFDSSNTIAKKFIVNNSDAVKDGYISIQSNSHPMQFKKIEIMEY